MASIDARIRLEAELCDDEDKGVAKRRLRRLRAFLDDETANMFRRCCASDPTITLKERRTKGAVWLRRKTYDDTFRDVGPHEQQIRSRERFELLLQLAKGDKILLLREYGAALDRMFPIPSRHFKWKPVFIKGAEGVVTVQHNWGRRS